MVPKGKTIFLSMLVLLTLLSFETEKEWISGTGKSPIRETGVVVESAYGKLPLYFIKNTGQLSDPVRYYEKGRGHSIFFTDKGISLFLSNDSKLKKKEAQRERLGNGSRSPESKLVEIAFLNSRESPEIIGEGLQQGKVNYFIGNDPKKWRTDIPTYRAVLQKEVWRGIDIRFYGNNRQLEYDIIVKPGADPSAINFKYEGIDGLELNKEGDLEIKAGDGSIIQRRPHIYQETGGRRVKISGGFKVLDQACKSPYQKTERAVLSSRLSYGFEVSSYDKDYPLIIDPVLIYSTYLGGNGSMGDQGQGISVDASGNAYLTGYTNSANFPTASPIQGGLAGDYDAFVTKINPAGNALVYSTYLGGNSDDWGLGIKIDDLGNAYVGGRTFSANFPTASPIQGSNKGDYDVFVTKINPAGNALVYSTYLGGNGEDWSWGIAIDASGAAYVTGHTQSSNFPLVSPIQGSYGGGEYDAFVAKINPAGSALVYSTYLGGSEHDYGRGISVDTSGNVYITGNTYSANFPTASPIQGSNAGDADAFITKINAPGNALVYSTYLGGGSWDFGRGISVDASGNAYATGKTHSANFPTASPIQGSKAGQDDAFVTKINPTGSALVYSTYLGKSGAADARGITIDTSGNVYITGEINGTFPTVSPIQGSLAGKYDAFVTRINSSGNALIYSTYFGGSESDYGMGIAVDNSGNAYITGGTFSTDFPVKAGFDMTYSGDRDAFAAKIFSPNKDDFIGAWDGQGVYFRNSEKGNWVKLSSAADLIAAGDLDGEGRDDLIGIFPTPAGVWVRYSKTGAWAKLSTTSARHIGSGDMNGDTRSDLIATWDGQGVYYRNSISGAWVKMAQPSNLLAAGDLDGDNVDDLLTVFPSPAGVWVKYSKTGTWSKLSSSSARDIACGDMNGDGRDDLLGTWDGQGIYYRNSISGLWVKVSIPGEQTTAGDLDGDGVDDLIAVWASPPGVWVKYSKTGTWAKLSSPAKDISAGAMTGAIWGSGKSRFTRLTAPVGGNAEGPMNLSRYYDLANEGPGGWRFAAQEEKNLIPEESGLTTMSVPGPGEPGFRWIQQKNLVPQEGMEPQRTRDNYKKPQKNGARGSKKE